MARVFTLEEARIELPELWRLTHAAQELAASLAEELAMVSAPGDNARAAELRLRLQALLDSWNAAVQERGGQVKGLWLVDFDAGDGFWCWAYPEEGLDHWHSYEGGFEARVPASLRPDPSGARDGVR